MICIVNASLILACVFVGPAIAFLGDIYYYFKYVSLVKIIPNFILNTIVKISKIEKRNN